ncbi:hypothetical protein D9M70_456250 [compost metagenome]
MDIGDVDARQHLLQVLHLIDLLRLQGAAAEGGDRCRHLLHVLLAAPRGDGDLGQAGVFLGLRALPRRLRGPDVAGGQVAAQGQQQGQCVFRCGQLAQRQRLGETEAVVERCALRTHGFSFSSPARRRTPGKTNPCQQMWR